MKRIITLAASLLAVAATLHAEEEKKEIVKTGLNFGPLPVVAFDADKGFQYGALLNIYDFGDGSTYPNPRQQFYIEASAYTKGTLYFKTYYDARSLIPGVRMTVGANYVRDKALDFYGFNGYRSFYDIDAVTAGKNKKGENYDNIPFETPYYRISRNLLLVKADFSGRIVDNLYWTAGYHFGWMDIDSINREKINRNKKDGKKFPDERTTLFEDYRSWGLISDADARGGFSSALQAGLYYDSRDVENSPSKGIWAEVFGVASPRFLGSSHNYFRLCATFRHYVPIVPDRLAFAYRLAYQGTYGRNAPYYVLPFQNIMGVNMDFDGIGGYRNVRGMLRDRVIARDVAFYNIELRYRFIDFRIGKQNIAFSLTAFTDGAQVVRGLDMTYRGLAEDAVARASYEAYIAKGEEQMQKGLGKANLHMTAGAGLRFIMNRNFIVAFEYGRAFNHQDGEGGFYINTGYLF